MSDAVAEPETLEALQARHRKEQRDLVSRVTQKKKQASKKTRKGVNDECDRLERDLKEKQERERRALNGEVDEVDEADEVTQDDDPLEEGVTDLELNGNNTQSQDTSVNGDDNEDASGGRKKKPNRAKARLARRAAEQDAMVREAEREAVNAPNPREIERERMAVHLEQHKLSLHEIRADGHCLYAAVADQLQTRELGLEPKIRLATIESTNGASRAGYKKVRYAAADWIEQNSDDFAGFMEDPLSEHVRKVRETGEWGGHLELLALARTYRVGICVLHSDGTVNKIEPKGDTKDLEEIWLGYYKHSHGLGEHYNSLRKAG
ncbi:cysteine proteinase [Setomelanomma holmii]|uniref:Cysteine proteinase n=1 Tax=Setomelanomma holmii TaxID=210430 RepID=A0A9P4H9C1_9PLEO|nr:cysteine proteinase [Setomelanomma holmii]